MKYPDEIELKIKEEIISLYEQLIEKVYETLVYIKGEKKVRDFFNELTQNSQLIFMEKGKVNLKDFLKDKNKDEIISCGNLFISSLIARIGERR